jgi:hypothetical protein
MAAAIASAATATWRDVKLSLDALGFASSPIMVAHHTARGPSQKNVAGSSDDEQSLLHPGGVIVGTHGPLTVFRQVPPSIGHSMRSTTLSLLALFVPLAACSSARPTPAAPSGDTSVARGDRCDEPKYKLRRSAATNEAVARTLKEINVADDRLIQVLHVEQPDSAPTVLYVVARCFRFDPNGIAEDGNEVYVEDTQADASGTKPAGFDPEGIAR